MKPVYLVSGKETTQNNLLQLVNRFMGKNKREPTPIYPMPVPQHVNGKKAWKKRGKCPSK